MLDREPDMEDTFSNYLMCRFMRYGCSWSAKWLPGDEAKARAALDQHEKGCIWRFHAPRP